MDEVLAKYSALAYSIAKNYRNKGLPWEDLKQESLIGLIKAYEHYDPGKETLFSTYATYWIRKQVIEAVKQEGNHNTVQLTESMFLNKQFATDFSTPASAVQSAGNELAEFTKHPTKSAANADVCNSLNLPDDMPRLEKNIMILSFVQQKSLKEISQYLNLSVEKIKQHKKKALRRLRALSFH